MEPTATPERTIAVVNDDGAFIGLVKDLLEERGWDVLGLREGNAAFEAIKRDRPSLVLLDIRMEAPDTGWRVLNLLMLDPVTAEIPVIMCSCDWVQLREKEEWMRAHGVHTLPRPFDVDDLYEAVAAASVQPVPRLTVCQ